MPQWTPPIKVANVIQSDIPIAWTIGRVSGFSNGAGCFRINNSGHGGRVAQLGEHLLCKQGVAGSNPVTSTTISNKTRVIVEVGENAGETRRVLVDLLVDLWHAFHGYVAWYQRRTFCRCYLDVDWRRSRLQNGPMR